MGFVVPELTEFLVERADGGSIGPVERVFRHVEPEAVCIGTGGVVSHEDVVWVADPERSRGLVCVKQAPRAPRAHHEVLLDDVLGFNGVLQENSVAHNVVNNVVFHRQVRDRVDGDCAVERLMDSVAFNKRLGDRPDCIEI